MTLDAARQLIRHANFASQLRDGDLAELRRHAREQLQALARQVEARREQSRQRGAELGERLAALSCSRLNE